jgi:hypothetical protein
MLVSYLVYDTARSIQFFSSSKFVSHSNIDPVQPEKVTLKKKKLYGEERQFLKLAVYLKCYIRSVIFKRYALKNSSKNV